MRKHFLILMLLALLPFAGWAEDAPTPAAPKAKTNLVYTSAAQDLVTAGVAHESKTYYYAVVDKDAKKPAYTAYATAASKKTNAGSYDVYYVELAANPSSETDVASATKLTVTIARANATITISSGDPISKEYGFKIADFTIEDVHTLIGGSNSGEGWTPTTYSGFITAADARSVAYTVNWDVDGNVNAGEHHYSISVNAMDNYNVSVVPSSGTWTITPKNLYIRAQNAELTYGDAFTGTEYVEYEGFIKGEDKSVLSGTLSWTTNYETGSAITGEAPLTTAYSWMPQGQTSTNYNITYQNGNITVKRKDITTTGVTINDIAAVTYNKTSQQPKAIEGTFTKGQFTRPLTFDTNPAKTDYLLSYYSVDDVNKDNAGKITGLKQNPTVLTALSNAGTYVVKIDGQNNFKGTVYKEFKINKKKLGVRAKDVNVVYDGTTNWISNVTNALLEINVTDGALNDFFDVIEFDGLVPASGQTNVEPAEADTYPAILANPNNKITVKFQQNAVDATEAIKAGDYNIVITSGTDIFTNYEPIYANGSQGGKLKVAKRVVKGKVVNQSKKFGTPDAFAEGVAGTKDLISITDPSTSGNDGLVNSHNITAYPLVKRDAGEEKNEYNLYLSYDETNKFVVKTIAQTPVDVTENYEFDITPGKFTIGEGTISIYANNKTITYGEMTVAQAKQALTAMVIGMTDAEVEQVQAAVNAKLTLVIPEELELEDDDFLPATTTGYSIKIGDLTGVIPADILANYNSTFNKFDENAKFIVNKKALTKIETKQQALQYGDKIDALKKNASTIVITGLVEGEDAEAVIAEMRFAFANYVTLDNGAITTPAGTTEAQYKDGVYFKGIQLDGDAALTNYSYPDLTDAKKFVAGNLVVTPATAAMKLDGFTSETVAADQANNITKLTENNGKKVNIQFANRSLKKEQWGVLVLPFETTVREISNALGYAVVDLINPAKGDENNVYFKLHMGTIPANTPFMVKTDANIDLSTISYDPNAVNVDLVMGKTIVKDVDEDGKTTGEDGAAGTKFYGLYKPVTLSHTYQWFMSAGDWAKKAEGKTTKVLALRAYLQLAANADVQNARVFIEEPDGTTTVIKAVNVDGLEVGNDGWFTLNGMKLNSVPTEKGIYIHNGKKVILK